MQIPKDVPVWEYAPSRKLAQITVSLKNVSGALAQSSKLVADMGIQVLSGFTSAPSESPIGVWSFFADVTDSEVDITKIRRVLLEAPLVEGVDIQRAEDGFMVDRQHFPVRFSNRRALIMRTDALSGMFDRMWSVFGTGAVAIIDQMAEAMGKHTAKEIMEDLGRDLAEQSLDEILSTYTALGYGQLEVKRTEESSMTIRATGLFECESNAKNDAGRKSTFFRGHLRGLLSTIFDCDYDVTEVECVAEGDQACSFNVSRTVRLETRLPLRKGN